jgi:hypothetical protein
MKDTLGARQKTGALFFGIRGKLSLQKSLSFILCLLVDK